MNQLVLHFGFAFDRTSRDSLFNEYARVRMDHKQ